MTAYNQAKQSYNTLITQRDQQLKQAELNLDSIVTNTNSTLTTLQSQLFALRSSLQSFTVSLRDHIDSVVGESIQYKSTAQTYEASLIARGREQYNTAQDDIRSLGSQKNTLDGVEVMLSGQALLDVVDEMKAIVQDQNNMLLNLQELYQLALPSAGFTVQLQ